MTKLTKTTIEKLVQEIKAYLEKYELATDCSIYYNNIVERSDTKYNEDYAPRYTWTVEQNINPHDYFEYAAYNHILSMSFEGELYESINYTGYKLSGFEKIFKKYDLYYELGNAWNLTSYPIEDDMEIEYTIYEKPKETIYLYRNTNIPTKLKDIMDVWYNLSSKEGDGGACVLGAGFNFDYENEKYFMPAQSPWQGSLSWEKFVNIIKKLLIDIGAEKVYYNWGVMD